MDTGCGAKEECTGGRTRTRNICAAGGGGADRMRGREEQGMGEPSHGSQSRNVGQSKSESKVVSAADINIGSKKLYHNVF